jgi:hypothetical protein
MKNHYFLNAKTLFWLPCDKAADLEPVCLSASGPTADRLGMGLFGLAEKQSEPPNPAGAGGTFCARTPFPHLQVDLSGLLSVSSGNTRCRPL